MNGKELLEAMGHVDERFVEEAEKENIRQGSGVLWVKWVSVAACFCLMVLLAFAPSEHGLVLGEDEPPRDTEGIAQLEGPEESPGMGSEVPAVILRVQAVREEGFTGTVEQLVDTDIFPIGMELNVVTADQEVNINTLVMVQFTDYDAATRTIVVPEVEPIDE